LNDLPDDLYERARSDGLVYDEHGRRGRRRLLGLVWSKPDYERIPWGYGLAWRDFARMESVVMPIPLNWIVGGVRKAYGGLARGPKLGTEMETYRVAFERGVRRGTERVERDAARDLAAAYEKGRREGYAEAMRSIYIELEVRQDS
jgi:hypothetical protein